MSSFKHIFFDLDHTLWDFDANSRLTIELLFEEKNLSQKLACEPDQFYQKYIEINDQKWSSYRKGEITKEQLRAERFYETFAAFDYFDQKFATNFESEYLATCPYQPGLIDGALEALDYLFESYDLSIITNGFYETQVIKLRESKLAPFFNHVFASDQLGVNKPHQRIFIESLKRAGASRKDSIMIGDSLVTDILGAKHCGIAQVYYNPGAQSHSEEISFEISSLNQLKNIL